MAGIPAVLLEPQLHIVGLEDLDTISLIDM